MSSWALLSREAAHEFRASLRGPLVPLVWIGLAIYIVLVMLNADYMREMGATSVARNSPHGVYLMVSGQSVIMFLAWAWMFGQTLLRERGARLHEVALAAPLPLRAMIFGRYLGAVGTACLIATSVLAGFAMAPALAWTGALPPEAVGPMPWFAMAWGFLVFALPNALFAGALYVAAVVWTRTAAGPLAASAGLALVWMVAMVVLRGGDVDPVLASAIDPTGFAEAEEQSNRWTPAEKTTAVLAVTPQLVVNRVLWLVLGFAALGAALWRATRERLVLEGSAAPVTNDRVDGHIRREAAPALGTAAPGWLSAYAAEAGWQWRVSTRGSGVRVAMGLLLLASVLGSFVNFVGHSEGPLVPRPEALLPFQVEFVYMIMVFVVSGAVGVLMRRDERPGFDELLDAAPAPLGVRVLGKVTAAFGMTALLCAIPAVEGLIVTAVGAFDATRIDLPFTFVGLILLPSMLEICALTVVVHALIRHAGAAYAASIFLAFVAVVNHELGVVEYPPLQFGIPPHVAPSEVVGWAPWLAGVLVADALKIGCVVAVVGASWLVWRRGCALRWSDRVRDLARRCAGSAGATVALGAAFVAVAAVVLYGRLVEHGEFQAVDDALADDAAWERERWHEAAPYTLTGGHVAARLDPAERLGSVDWELRGVRTARLHATLPHGLALVSAEVAGNPRRVERTGDHVVIAMPECVDDPCRVRLSLDVALADWPVEEDPPWLHGSGVWLRAADLLPTLGHDPERLVVAPADRQRHGLPVQRPEMPDRDAFAPAMAVAPAGDWSWTVSFPAGGHVVAASGATDGPLDFASVWSPEPLSPHGERGPTIRHGPTRGDAAELVRVALAETRGCVETALGHVPDVDHVVQAPRGSGEAGVHGGVLWLPEEVAWDAGDEGLGKWLREERIARALAKRSLADRADLRLEPGARWYLDGVAGQVALSCVERASGLVASLALQTRHADRTAEGLGTLDEPVDRVAAARGEWLRHYAALATLAWSAGLSRERTAQVFGELPARIRQPGETLTSALVAVVGSESAAALLGPPLAADVALIPEEEELRLSARRWAWAGAGWVADETPERLRLVPAEGSGAPTWVSARGPLAAPRTPFVIRDASPAYERTVDDNYADHRMLGGASGH